MNEQTQARFGISIAVRVGVHRGLVYLDTEQDDVYGLAANLTARVSGLAQPNVVVMSDAVEPLVHKNFELKSQPAAPVKGIDGLILYYTVTAEQTAGTRVRGPLVGRDRELARLEKSWARAQAGTLATPGVVFRGEPGIGKSRLVGAAISLVERDGGVTLELLGSPFHTDVGLHPVRSLIERRCGIDRLTDPAERLRLLDCEIRSLAMDPEAVRGLAPVLGIAPEHGYQPVDAEGRKLQELVIEAVRDYLLACFEGRPGLLVAEDVHWFDPSTIDLVGQSLGVGEGRLMVVVTGRPGGWLADGWPVKVFELAALSDEHTHELAAALDPGLTADQRRVVRERCDGVPFYIEQVVATFHTSDNTAAVPETLYEPLFARLRASPNVVPVVEAAAVIGREVDRELLLAAVTLNEDELDDVIDELEDALVLEAWGDHGWRFRHELLREVAAELAPPSVRRELHVKVGDALSHAVGGGDPDWRLVATHYEQAQRFDRAADSYRRASLEAQRRGALAEARTYLASAIGHLDRVTPSPERNRGEMALRLQRGMLAGAAEGPGSTAWATDMERCLRLGGTDLKDDQLFAALNTMTVYYIIRGDLRRAEPIVVLVETARPEIPMRGAWGVMSLFRGDLDAARPLLRGWKTDMSRVTQELEDTWVVPFDYRASTCIAVAIVSVLQGDLIRSETELAEALQHSEGLRFRWVPTRARMHVTSRSGCTRKAVSWTKRRDSQRTPWHSQSDMDSMGGMCLPLCKMELFVR